MLTRLRPLGPNDYRSAASHCDVGLSLPFIPRPVEVLVTCVAPVLCVRVYVCEGGHHTQYDSEGRYGNSSQLISVNVLVVLALTFTPGIFLCRPCSYCNRGKQACHPGARGLGESQWV